MIKVNSRSRRWDNYGVKLGSARIAKPGACVRKELVVRLILLGISRRTRRASPFAWIMDRHGYMLPILLRATGKARNWRRANLASWLVRL